MSVTVNNSPIQDHLHKMIMLNLLMAQQKVAKYIFCGVRINSEKKISVC